MYFVVKYSSKGDVFFDMHNKEYALKLVQEKLNGNNSYSYWIYQITNNKFF